MTATRGRSSHGSPPPQLVLHGPPEARVVVSFHVIPKMERINTHALLRQASSSG